MSEARLNIVKTREIKRPTYYVGAILHDFAQFAFDEERAPEFKGVWQQNIFIKSPDTPLDLEIGTGIGLFFTHHAISNPGRSLLGLELKFKPLIQAIRRALNQGAQNARMVRYHAGFVRDLFASEELDNVYIHHPDPWTKRSKHKHRLIRADFLDTLWGLQKFGSFVEFKTDSQEYFIWAAEEFKQSKYQVQRYSEDLHSSEWCGENFITQFEKMFIAQGLPIYYLRAYKTHAE